MADNEPSGTSRSYPLATWLSGGSLLIVFAALAIMAIASGLIVTRFAHRQALARSELAVSTARDYFRRLGESSLGAARSFADNATLNRTLGEPLNALTFGIYLRGYCESLRASACAVAASDGAAGDTSKILATSDAALPWPEIANARHEQGERFALAPHAGGPALLGAAARLTARPEFAVLIVQALDGAPLAEAGRQAGATVRALNISAYRAPDADPMTPVHAAALSARGRAAAHVAALDSYAASTVMLNAIGEPVALIDALLPGSEFDRTAATYRHVVMLVTLLVAALAGLAGLLAARWLAAPVVRLADMARRIGQGDFSPAVPAAIPRELDALAHAMDEMRQNLIELTSRLRRREAEAQAVLNGVVEGVFVTDEQRVVRYANTQLARMLRRDATTVLGQFCGDVLHAHIAAAARPCERNCPILQARTHSAARCVEALRLADGTVLSTVVVSAAPSEGRQVQLLRDETDLEAARRARDSVLGNISHEFRTPLAAQLAAVELLRAGLNDLKAADQSQLLANVERGVLRLMRLIDNLLESVRIESGQVAIRSQLIDLETPVREAVELLAPLLEQHQLSVAIELAALAGRRVPGDEQRLQQVFVNLLANAIKFAPPGSSIRIGGECSASAIQIWVEDEGAGLPAGDTNLLFERFQRGEHREPDSPGLGLGLWIVRSIIERHAGSVRIERTALARTRFLITLPLA
jgi:signal transduction histidine kinase/HAMP domain-containing protein/type II secretory pathway pseudopilin PulG